MTDLNMTKYLPKLSLTEQQVICNVIRGYAAERYRGAHPGTLPFIPVNMVIACLLAAQPNRRIYHELLAKLDINNWSRADGDTYWSRKLNDPLVYWHFGDHPERGVAIPGLQAIVKHERQRKMFEKELDAVDMLRPMVTLKRLAPGLWNISCSIRYRHYVDSWLQDHCTGG